MVLRLALERLARGRRQAAGTGLDANPVLSRLGALREDFVAELQSHERDGAYQRALMKSAREAVVKLTFFRRRTEIVSRAEEHAHAMQEAALCQRE